MSTQIVQEIQTNLGYAELEKIDPNEGDQRESGGSFGNHAIAQAAIPSILCGFADFIRIDENARLLMNRTAESDLLGLIFCDQKKELISRVSDYANTSLFETEKEMEHIANETERILIKLFPDRNNFEAIREYFADQQHEILSYLPGSLHTGELLHHDTIDDNTHKMEGPVSTFMHGVEKFFNE
jgi:hypothetical protein